MPQPIQIGAITALRGPQDCVTETVAVYKERRDALIDGLGQDGEGCWKIEKPLATMFVWAPIPGRVEDDRVARVLEAAPEGSGRRGVARASASGRRARASCASRWSRTNIGSARRCAESARFLRESKV